MKNLIVLITILSWLTPLVSRAEDEAWEIETLSPKNEFIYDLRSGSAAGTNGVIVKYGGAVLMADRVTVDQKTGDCVADGNVRIQREEQLWVGEHVNYNFKTRVMETAQFRTGRSPAFAEGYSLRGESSNHTYFATNALVTTDDYSEPAITIRARKIKIVTGKYFEARNALLYLGGVPVFYLPYYKRNLGAHANNFNFTPGYRSRYGPFLLGTYSWYASEELDGAVHVDYRLKRGVGAGPDLNYHLGKWGEGSIRYYYLHDEDPEKDNQSGQNIPHDRQRVYFNYFAEPYTNLTARSQVRYQSDPNVNRDFFGPDYRNNPQPSTYFNLNKFWDNFSLDTVVQPRVNDFYETIERLPEIHFTGYRQQLGKTPFYYQSDSSFAYLQHKFAETNGPNVGLDYSAARADTYQQILLPYTLFGWLNLTPRAGGRFTYYTEATGAGGTNSQESRTVFDTGMEASFKLARTWPGTTSKLLAVDGIRHIIEPSVNYVYVPNPSERPKDLPQFDYMLPSLRLRPIQFPEMNSIDGINSENTFRLGVRNTIQTKRDSELAKLLEWELYTDWRLNQHTNEDKFANLYSDLLFAPRKWLTLESELQFDMQGDQEGGVVPLSFHTLTIAPNNTWSWSLSHYYLRSDPSIGTGNNNNVVGSSIFYRLNENWGLQTAHYFDINTARMQEQFYSIYRDFRAWTSALTFRISDSDGGQQDFTVALTFSLKAQPRYGLGSDAVRPYYLTGG